MVENGLLYHVLPLVIDGCLTTGVRDVIYRLGKLARYFDIYTLYLPVSMF